MVRRGSLRQVIGALIVVVLLASGAAAIVVERAGASGNRCERHAADSQVRGRAVTGAGQDVVVIGDSWSVGLGQRDLAGSWASRLPGRVRVAGFSGSGFSPGASPCRAASFAARAAAAVAPGADLVVVQGGLNDHDQPDVAIERGFRQLMTVLADERVLVVGPAAAPSRADAVPHVDDVLDRLAGEYGVPYVATSDVSLPYLRDRLHLTTAGHREYGDLVAERIAEVTPREPTPVVTG